jgi:hypothetical protein
MAIKKSYWIGIPLLMAGAAWYGVYQWNKAPDSLAQREPKHVMEAQQLLSKFQTNTAGANQKYINQVIEISGTCMNVESQGDSVHFVYIGGRGSGDVLCQLESQKGALPSKGDPIQCKGVCTGYDDLTGGVLMNRCILTGP